MILMVPGDAGMNVTLVVVVFKPERPLEIGLPLLHATLRHRIRRNDAADTDSVLSSIDTIIKVMEESCS